MKKLYLLFSFLPLFAFAQPTIQQSDEPIVNLWFSSAIDNNYSDTIPAGGANQTWHYSNLQFVDTGGGHFVSAVGTPYQSIFNTSNLAVQDLSRSEWAYFTTASTGFYTNGFDSAGLNIVINPPLMYVPVPFTYNNIFTSAARVEVDTSFDTLSFTVPVKYIHTISSNFVADGYGTLELPLANYSNVLRIKDREVSTDSIIYRNPFTTLWTLYGVPTSSQAHYYRYVRHSGPDVFLLQVSADSAGTTATRSEYELFSIISVPEIHAEHVQVNPYPNPVITALHIDFGAAKGLSGTLSVYNAMGALVRTSSFEDINTLVLYVNSFANGVYHFAVSSSDNKIREGSFVVNH